MVPTFPYTLMFTVTDTSVSLFSQTIGPLPCPSPQSASVSSGELKILYRQYDEGDPSNATRLDSGHGS